MEGPVKFTNTRPRDTVGTLAFLERRVDEEIRAGRLGWILAFVFLGLTTLFAILWLACRYDPHGSSDVRSEPSASAISRVLPGGYPGNRSARKPRTPKLL